MILAGRGVQLRGKFKPGKWNRENGILGPSSRGGVSIPSMKGGALLLSEDSEEESMVNESYSDVEALRKELNGAMGAFICGCPSRPTIQGVRSPTDSYENRMGRARVNRLRSGTIPKIVAPHVIRGHVKGSCFEVQADWI
jgi:hypothetical protein